MPLTKEKKKASGAEEMAPHLKAVAKTHSVLRIQQSTAQIQGNLAPSSGLHTGCVHMHAC